MRTILLALFLLQFAFVQASLGLANGDGVTRLADMTPLLKGKVIGETYFSRDGMRVLLVRPFKMPEHTGYLVVGAKGTTNPDPDFDYFGKIVEVCGLIRTLDKYSTKDDKELFIRLVNESKFFGLIELNSDSFVIDFIEASKIEIKPAD